ncbi:hypothetical protein DRI50_03885 [candidate division KSB1 bacterium]|nr:MAG: hypothetical protein DRI50_03885 [candidate division KSB1 bacterium]
MQKLLHYETLTDAELKDLNKEAATVILPISLLEAHGPHLPLGTDFLMAAKVSDALGERILKNNLADYALVLPAIPLGAGGILRSGTLNHGEILIEQVIVEFGERLADYGFTKGIIVSGHAGKGHLKAMSEAADVLYEMGIFDFLPLTSYLFTDKGMEKMKAALKKQYKQNPENAIPLYDGHAGCWETSMALLFFRELVREKYKTLPHSDSAEENGYRGNPFCASEALGAKLRDFLLDTASEVIREHFEAHGSLK